jgi:predicted Zn-dependent protease
MAFVKTIGEHNIINTTVHEIGHVLGQSEHSDRGSDFLMAAGLEGRGGLRLSRKDWTAMNQGDSPTP